MQGFGFVSYKTLEGAQKCRFESAKHLFRSSHRLLVSQFEQKALRGSRLSEKVDNMAFRRYKHMEQNTKAKGRLEQLRTQLSSKGGQQFLSLLKQMVVARQQSQVRPRGV